MSQKYPGGFITKSPVAPTSTAASGIWTLDQQQQAQKAGTWPAPPMFIEDMFSTWLYTGNGGTQTITNGINVSGKGGLVWAKSRSNVIRHSLYDTARGANFQLSTNTTEASSNAFIGDTAISFTSTGFTTGSFVNTNTNAATYVSWTFAEQPKFFDIVTWTGDGTGNRAIPHNLGSTPGFITTKRTSTTSNWVSYHRAVTSPNANWWRNYGYLDLPDTFIDFGSDTGLYQSPDSSNLYVGSYYNASGVGYLAYIFAHNAGGFPASGAGSDNGITCGSYTAGSSETTVNLGYEPQWTMIKATSTTDDWRINDNMRGVATNGVDRNLAANLDNAEYGSDDRLDYNATGFTAKLNNSNAGETYIYIAIRRGPMKTPTTGTSVFAPVAYAGDSSATRLVNAGVNIDANISARRSGPDFFVQSRLTGVPYLRTRSVNAETSSAGTNGIPTILTSENNKFGFIAGSSGLSNVNETGSNYVDWAFTRAPTFFDVVCYTGTGANRTVTHNLAAAPELMLVKQRSGTEVWSVYYGDNTDYLVLNSDQATTDSNIYWNDTSPTSSVFTLGTGNEVNSSGSTYVAYLFATCAGVSKVGSFTGTGSTQTIDCGFTGGARFVLIKATSTTGAWYVWDSARGIVAGNDPYLALNIGTAEVTNTDWVDTAATGFEITSTAPAAINASGGTFIFLAIA
jgi:hypothetical protein